MTDLIELIMAGTPLSRKPMYRQYVLKKFPNLKFMDGREVTAEEKERAELLFNTDSNPNVVYSQSSSNAASNSFTTISLNPNMITTPAQNNSIPNAFSNLVQNSLAPLIQPSNNFPNLANSNSNQTAPKVTNYFETQEQQHPLVRLRPINNDNSFASKSKSLPNSNNFAPIFPQPANPGAIGNVILPANFLNTLSNSNHSSGNYSNRKSMDNASSLTNFASFVSNANNNQINQAINSSKASKGPNNRLRSLDRPISGSLSNPSSNNLNPIRPPPSMIPNSVSLNSISASQLLHALGSSSNNNSRNNSLAPARFSNTSRKY